MNWFSGNIAEAVALSKAKNSTFVVYCEGSDDLSKEFTALVNNDTIRSKLESNDFVAIKVQSDSEAYMQFAQIYKLVPLPSLFFIGKNGTPLEIVTGVTKTVEELVKKIESVLGNVKSNSDLNGSNVSANLIANERSTSTDCDTEVVCENGVCYKRPKATNAGKQQQSTSIEATQHSNEEKLKRAAELIEKKRKDKEEEDARVAKERELQRRRVGQDLQSFKQRQQEDEMKKLQEERKRDKILEQADRKRILEQIAADKAERAQRFNAINAEKSNKPKEASNTLSNNLPIISSDITVANIQFKKPDGEVEVKTFDRDETFASIRSYVEENVIVGSGIIEFALSTTFPRREFKPEDNEKKLIDLGLVPSAVILVLPLDKAPSRKLPVNTNYGFIAMLTTIFWGVVNPVLAIFSYAKNRFNSLRNQSGAAKRANEEELNHNDRAKKRVLRFGNQETASPLPSTSTDSNQSGPYKRAGVSGSNIHRLSDQKDSDDENNTWNGNSTQQQ